VSAILRNIRANSGAGNAEWTAFVRKWTLISALVLGITAFFSLDCYKPDEYFQTIAFAHYKLGPGLYPVRR